VWDSCEIVLLMVMIVVLYVCLFGEFDLWLGEVGLFLLELVWVELLLVYLLFYCDVL